jgi:D-alanyl-D-alanine carboxypeptidase
MNTVKSILLIFIPLWLILISESSYGRHAEIIIDAENGSVLHELNATHSWFPASLTKVMTLYVAFDALKKEEIHLHDVLTASTRAAHQPQSKLGLRLGDEITVRDAILALITRSANDAAVVLAEHLGGTEESFAVKMTTKAHELGMVDTHFMNATGLPHQWQVTTSRDMALLAWKTHQNFPNYYPYFSAHTFNYKGRELRGINKFTANYPGAEGMKTGFTCGSGYNLISVANQNGKRLIGVILGGMTSAERYQLMTTMMNNGFANNFNPNPVKNINTMTTNFAGTPPYQLGCGNKAPIIFDSSNEEKKYNDRIKHSGKHHHTIKTKTIGKSNYYIAKKQSISSKNSPKKTYVNKNKLTSKTLLIKKHPTKSKIKNTHYHQS